MGYIHRQQITMESYGSHSYGAMSLNFEPNKDGQNIAFAGTSHTLGGPSTYVSQSYPCQSRVHQSQPIVRGRNFYQPAPSIDMMNRTHALPPTPTYFQSLYSGYGKPELQHTLQQSQHPTSRNTYTGNGHGNYHPQFIQTKHPSQSPMVGTMPLRLESPPMPPSRQVYSATIQGENVMWSTSSAFQPQLSSNAMVNGSVYPTQSIAPHSVLQKRKYPVYDSRTIAMNEAIASHEASWTQGNSNMMMIPMMNNHSDSGRMKRPKLNGSSYMKINAPNPEGLPHIDTISSSLSLEEPLEKSNVRREKQHFSVKIPVDLSIDAKNCISRNSDDLNLTSNSSSSRRELEVIAANILCSFSKIHDSNISLEDEDEGGDKKAIVSPDVSTDNLFESHPSDTQNEDEGQFLSRIIPL